jgi:long-chain acyl-CoA synthetase
MPRAVLDDLSRTKATVLPGMPVFYQAFCDLDAVPDLLHLRLCISAGAPLPLSVAQRFRDKFGKAVHSFYGSSECGGICYDREAALVAPGFVGRPIDGVELELLDRENGAARVRVRSAAAGDGYFPEADVAKLGLGAFMPDDLLAEQADGFAIVGRTSDVINVAGKKVNPAEVEATLLGFAGVRDAAVFGLQSILRNEEVAACIVASDRVTEAALLEFCRSRLSGWQVPKRLFFLAKMPVNERGKISRRALAERFAP